MKFLNDIKQPNIIDDDFDNTISSIVNFANVAKTIIIIVFISLFVLCGVVYRQSKLIKVYENKLKRDSVTLSIYKSTF